MNNLERYNFIKFANDGSSDTYGVPQWPWQTVGNTWEQTRGLEELNTDPRISTPHGNVINDTNQNRNAWVRNWSPGKGVPVSSEPLYQDYAGNLGRYGDFKDPSQIVSPYNNLRRNLTNLGVLNKGDNLDIKRLPSSLAYSQFSNKELAIGDGRGFFPNIEPGQPWYSNPGKAGRFGNFFGSLVGAPGASMIGGVNQMVDSVGNLENPTLYITPRGDYQFITPGDQFQSGAINTVMGGAEAIPLTSMIGKSLKGGRPVAKGSFKKLLAGGYAKIPRNLIQKAMKHPVSTAAGAFKTDNWVTPGFRDRAFSEAGTQHGTLTAGADGTVAIDPSSQRGGWRAYSAPRPPAGVTQAMQGSENFKPQVSETQSDDLDFNTIAGHTEPSGRPTFYPNRYGDYSFVQHPPVQYVNDNNVTLPYMHQSDIRYDKSQPDPTLVRINDR